MICINQARACLIVFNLAFWIMGFGLMILGIWTKFDDNFFNIWNSFDTNLNANTINAVWILLIVCGLFTGILGIIGYLGAVKKSRSLLTIYLMIIFSLLVLEQLALWLSVTYQVQLHDIDLKGLMKSAFFKNNTISTGIMDLLQISFSCCGTTGPFDYQNITIPASCYPDISINKNLTNKNFYTEGCYALTIAKAKDKLPIITTSLFASIFFEIFALICTIVLCTRNEAKIEVYDTL